MLSDEAWYKIKIKDGGSTDWKRLKKYSISSSLFYRFIALVTQREIYCKNDATGDTIFTSFSGDTCSERE